MFSRSIDNHAMSSTLLEYSETFVFELLSGYLLFSRYSHAALVILLAIE